MPTNQKSIVRQIDDLLAMYSELSKRKQLGRFSDLPKDVIYELVTRMFAAIDRLAPQGSKYFEHARHWANSSSVYDGSALSPLAGILKALRDDYEAGYLQTVTELIHADVFGDFLEMADYLIEQGYKDPAAVIAGSVLEEHLRKLCGKSGIPVDQNNKPKKADTMNAELAGANVYSKLDQKSVTAWLDLRNKAAHGKYTEYTLEQVALMLLSIRDFLSRHPA